MYQGCKINLLMHWIINRDKKINAVKNVNENMTEIQ